MTRELVAAIIGLWCVMYLTRIGGLLIASRLPRSDRLDRTINQLPGLTLVALVAPSIANFGVRGWIAAGIVWILANRFGNFLVAFLGGVIAIVLLRL